MNCPLLISTERRDISKEEWKRLNRQLRLAWKIIEPKFSQYVTDLATYGYSVVGVP